MSAPPTKVKASESTNEQLARIREHIHPHCVVCGSQNLAGLRLNFDPLPDGSVQAEFDCGRLFEGYPNTLHGGIICLLLDGAMTNCLFAQGRTALTGELCVRFHHPVATERTVSVRARIEHSGHQLHYLAAELRQDGAVMATATAKFVEQPSTSPHQEHLRGRRSSA
jgi:acyl-coenzyme A thioesterase PaaI-like protein